MLFRVEKIRSGIGCCLLFVLLAINTSLVFAESERLRVGFLCSAPPGHPFWGPVVQAMQAVANDLDIELIVKYDETRSTYVTKRLGNHLISKGPKLDYFLTKYWSSVTDSHIQQAKERGTKVFVFNSDILREDYPTVGRRPREMHAHFIGQAVPDDRKAGYELASILVKRAQQIKAGSSDDKINVLALVAPAVSAVRYIRVEGLKTKIDEIPEAILEDVVETNWESGSASQVIADLLQQYPQTDVIWSANEAIAWGAVQAVEKLNKIPGKDIIVGGFDWEDESIKAIADGRMTASMFGHFMEGAWALLLVHDYHYGFDFADDFGVRISTPLAAITTDNYEKYQPLIQDADWEDIDFKKFSKKYNPQLKSYNFNINQFIK
ncbi:MAG: ABC transporter substrate-binding protein [Gammaproteobacteria bacterium]|nr:ABC transporter substrate-binding protein [Gammaproteobacteria bacterium]